MKGTPAFYDADAKQVVCRSCAGVAEDQQQQARVDRAPSYGDDPGLWASDSEASPDAIGQVESGTPGASAMREFERRVAMQEQRIRERHPKLGGLIIALSDDPQSTTAWRSGARGEQVLGRRLDALADRGVHVLHDRRIPGSRANIDHIAISSGGVFVLDAKRYKGRPTLKAEGGILRPRTETLLVGGRRCDHLVDGMRKQLGVVAAALAAEHSDVPLAGMLVFIEADWPLLGGDFATRGVNVLWPKKATEHILAPGQLTDSDVSTLHAELARLFPPA